MEQNMLSRLRLQQQCALLYPSAHCSGVLGTSTLQPTSAPTAVRVLQAGVIAELPLYDMTPGVRLGVASMMMSAWPQLSLEAVRMTGCFSLEQLLQQEGLFGRLLTVKDGQGGRRCAV